jgi:guanosine-3',5'-bis(diphosphate) 3'-pyrophosphohydrolase
LSFVVTNRARTKIRHYLNTAEKLQAIEIGRKHLDRALRGYGLTLKKALAEPAKLDKIAEELGAGAKGEDLFAGLGYGKISARQVLGRLVPAERLEKPAAPEPGALKTAVKRLLRVGEERIRVKGSDDLLITRAKCCNPIMGEPIVGYITRGKGVSVHSLNCPNVANLVYDPDRRIAVEWEAGAEGGYEVRLAVGLQDRPGALAAVTAALAAVKTDVRDAQVRTFDDKTASIELTVRINDLKHLDKVLKSVRGVAGVTDVARQAVPR